MIHGSGCLKGRKAAFYRIATACARYSPMTGKKNLSGAVPTQSAWEREVEVFVGLLSLTRPTTLDLLRGVGIVAKRCDVEAVF